MKPAETSVVAGETLGVEEEYFLVDPETFELSRRPELAEGVRRHRFGARVHSELQTTQIEISTEVCRTTAELRSELRTARGEAAAAAASIDATILATSTHPFATWREQDLVDEPRYRELYEQSRAVAVRQDICGCHVHVSVPDLDTAVAVMSSARPYVPVLLALTGSSPFHEGVDTGYDSFRTVRWSAWPSTGIPPLLHDADEYEAHVQRLVDSGAVVDLQGLYWDMRPSSRYPTLEFRMADVCTDLDTAVTYAAVVRSLVRTLARRVEQGVPAPDIEPDLLAAARWRAARFGLSGDLVDPATGRLGAGRIVVRRFLAELEPDLRDAGEYDEIAARVATLTKAGTSATRQRAVLRRHHSMRSVVRAMVAETTEQLAAVTPSAPGPRTPADDTAN